MVGTIIGGALGFLGAVVPEIIAFLQKRYAPTTVPVVPMAPPSAAPDVEGVVQGNDAKIHTESTNVALVSLNTALDVEPARAADRPFSSPLASRYPIVYLFFDGVRGSVRPVLTYAFFGLFAFIKIFSLFHAFAVDHTTAVVILPILWDEGTEALFAAVIAFWFGSRTITHVKRGV